MGRLESGGVSGSVQARARARNWRWAGSLGLLTVSLLGPAQAFADVTPAGEHNTNRGAADERRAAAAAHRADVLFDAGAKDFEQGRYSEALSNLESAHATYPTFRTAAVLGQVELHLKSYRDAAEHLDYALRALPSTSEHETRQRVMRGLTEARRNVHALSVHCNARGAELLIDGALAAVTPLGHELFVEAGNHEILVRRAGYKDYALTGYFPAGGGRRIRAELESVGPGNDGPAPPPVGDGATGPERTQDWSPAVWALGGTVVLGAATVGVLYSESAWHAEGKAADRATTLGTGACLGNDTPFLCREIEEFDERSRAHQTYAWVAYGVAGGAALATLGLVWLLDQPETVAFDAAVGPQGASLSVGGRF